jgi:hypothetical protein
LDLPRWVKNRHGVPSELPPLIPQQGTYGDGAKKDMRKFPPIKGKKFKPAAAYEKAD